MLMKLAIFGLGYVLGSRAGRARYDAIVAGARDIVRGEEVAAVVGFVRGGLDPVAARTLERCPVPVPGRTVGACPASTGSRPVPSGAAGA